MEHLSDDKQRQILAEMDAGRARLEHHRQTTAKTMTARAKEEAQQAEKKVSETELELAKLRARIAELTGTEVVRDGSNTDGKTTSSAPVAVNVEAFVESVKRAKAEHPDHAHEISPAADVVKRAPREPKPTKDAVLGKLDELLKS